MPTTTNEGVTLHYKRDGDGETVTFIGEAGFGPWQWAWQYDGLSGPYETLLVDLRGTGRSDTPPGPYDIDTLASDLEAVLAASEVRRTHLVGAGLGGMVALRYARRYNRAATLSLFGTAPRGEQVDEQALSALYPESETASPETLEATLDGAFTAELLSTETDLVDQICQWRREDDATPAGFDAQREAMCAFESGPLYEQTLPTLVCHGLADPVVSVDVGRKLATDLPRGTFEPVEGKRLCFIEHAPAVTDRLDGFFLEHSDKEHG